VGVDMTEVDVVGQQLLNFLLQVLQLLGVMLLIIRLSSGLRQQKGEWVTK
jgi:hypothetical protein